jgi:hypothetical protein
MADNKKLKDRVQPDFIPDTGGDGGFIADDATPTGAGGPGTPPSGLPPIGGPAPMQSSQLMERMTGAPLTGIESGLPSPAQTPENQEAMGTGAMIGGALGGGIAGGPRAMPGILRTMGASATGGAIGGALGRELGGLGGPRGAQIGGTLGALGGSLAGGYRGAMGKTVPAGTRLSLLEKMMGTREAPPPDLGPTYIPPTHEEIPLGHPDYPGPTMNIPSRMPRAATTKAPAKSLSFGPVGTSSANPQWQGELPTPSGPAQPFPPLTERVSKAATKEAKSGRGATGSAQPPFEPLVWESPEEAQAHDVRMQNLERQAKSAGMFSAAQGKAGRPLNYQQRIGRVEGMSAAPSAEYPSPQEFQDLRQRMMPESPTLTQRIAPTGGVSSKMQQFYTQPENIDSWKMWSKSTGLSDVDAAKRTIGEWGGTPTDEMANSFLKMISGGREKAPDWRKGP